MSRLRSMKNVNFFHLDFFPNFQRISLFGKNKPNESLKFIWAHTTHPIDIVFLATTFTANFNAPCIFLFTVPWALIRWEMGGIYKSILKKFYTWNGNCRLVVVHLNIINGFFIMSCHMWMNGWSSRIYIDIGLRYWMEQLETSERRHITDGINTVK